MVATHQGGGHKAKGGVVHLTLVSAMHVAFGAESAAPTTPSARVCARPGGERWGHHRLRECRSADASWSITSFLDWHAVQNATSAKLSYKGFWSVGRGVMSVADPFRQCQVRPKLAIIRRRGRTCEGSELFWLWVLQSSLLHGRTIAWRKRPTHRRNPEPV
jgi:hypothetical protein